MLQEALLVAARRAEVEQEKQATAGLLNQLPIAVLREIVETGEIKLAFGPCSPDGDGGGSWVSQFKGTPFFQQAIALEQECLQAEMANQQASSVNNQKSQEQYALMDQIRLKKKLLELQQARNEAQVLDGGAGPPAAAGSPDPTGTAPGGPAGPPMEDLKTVTASFKLALSTATLGSYAKKQMDPSGLASASKSLTGRGAQLIAGGEAAAGVKKVNQGNLLARKATSVVPGAMPEMAKAASVQTVEGWARQMAQADAEKIAHAKETLAIGDAAGRLMAKTALAGTHPGAGVAEALIHHFTQHPEHALAAAGALGGAAHGLLKQDGGVTDAIGEGVAGAGAGYTAGAMGKHLLAGHGVTQSAQRAIAGAHSDIKGIAKASGGIANKAINFIKPEANKVPVADVS